MTSGISTEIKNDFNLEGSQEEVTFREHPRNPSNPIEFSSSEMSFPIQRADIEGHSSITNTDSKDGLDIFCYTYADDSSEPLVKRCRGVVYSGDTLVSRGFSYTPEYSRETIPEDLSKFVKEHTAQCGFARALEGTIVRAFNYNDKWYLVTNRKLDAFKSRWSSKKSFGEIFVESLVYLYSNYQTFREWLKTTDALTHRETLDALKEEYDNLYTEETKGENKGEETQQSVEKNREVEEVTPQLIPPLWVREPQEYEWTEENKKDLLESFLSHLDPEYQYSFLVRSGEETRIVWEALDHPEVYLVGCFNKEGQIVPSPIFPFPIEPVYKLSSFDELLSILQKMDYRYDAGFVIFLPDGTQFKIYCDKYYDLFMLRGNEPSIKFRYLSIRMDDQKNEMYRALYPRWAPQFDKYDEVLEIIFTDLYDKYHKRFIHKQWVEVPEKEFTVLLAFHREYKNTGAKLVRWRAQEVFNNLSPSLLNHLIGAYLQKERQAATAK